VDPTSKSELSKSEAKCLTKNFNFVPGLKIVLKGLSGQVAGELLGRLLLIRKVKKCVVKTFSERIR